MNKKDLVMWAALFFGFQANVWAQGSKEQGRARMEISRLASQAYNYCMEMYDAVVFAQIPRDEGKVGIVFRQEVAGFTPAKLSGVSQFVANFDKLIDSMNRLIPLAQRYEKDYGLLLRGRSGEFSSLAGVDRRLAADRDALIAMKRKYCVDCNAREAMTREETLKIANTMFAISRGIVHSGGMSDLLYVLSQKEPANNVSQRYWKKLQHLLSEKMPWF